MADDVQDKRPCKKNGTRQRATRAGNGAAERAAARKRLAAIKAIMKSKIKQEELVVSPETPMESEKVVFDGGFFQIESPAKPFSDWTPNLPAGFPICQPNPNGFQGEQLHSSFQQ
ncbi:disks large-associated protein 5-like [Sceloporus undulatus]|uniref:disks large-associated protein 5-like n=1 Tax=Sceloporus undulatus TaxID=8520 RepID=UPI001C4BC19C|nr:disks large-associated protein 5-like [Sceloporus undulatus]